MAGGVAVGGEASGCPVPGIRARGSGSCSSEVLTHFSPRYSDGNDARFSIDNIRSRPRAGSRVACTWRCPVAVAPGRDGGAPVGTPPTSAATNSVALEPSPAMSRSAQIGDDQVTSTGVVNATRWSSSSRSPVTSKLPASGRLSAAPPTQMATPRAPVDRSHPAVTARRECRVPPSVRCRSIPRRGPRGGGAGGGAHDDGRWAGSKPIASTRPASTPFSLAMPTEPPSPRRSPSLVIGSRGLLRRCRTRRWRSRRRARGGGPAR